MIDEWLMRAGTNARLRTNYNIHESPSDPVQRLFIASMRESYFRPHRHAQKWECALVIRGLFHVMVFDDAGRVIECVPVGSGVETIGFEIPHNTWHTWIPMTDAAVFFEIKQGPYDAQTAAEFAPWSPEEGTAPVDAFIARLREAKVGDIIV
jgi:cupin fold WbuC family metalloprotein